MPVEQTDAGEGEGGGVEAGDPTVVTVQPLNGGKSTHTDRHTHTHKLGFSESL